MICPRCTVAEISPVTNQCELCGFTPGGVAVSAPDLDALDEHARTELAHQFSLDVVLRRGPTSIVYLAREPGLDRQLVLKVMARPADSEAETRFQRVIAAAGALSHPHIVPVHGFGTTASTCWYSMPYVHGRSLREVLRDDGPLDRGVSVRTVEQIASALDHAHRRGIVHGDLKPENVLIDANGWAQVCDFAVRFALEGASPARSRRATSRLATYLAPEALESGPPGPYADQYALAVLLHECLRGTVPDAGGFPLLSEWRADIPHPFALAVRRAMSPKPTDRFAGVLEFVSALEANQAPLALAAPTGRTSGRVLFLPDWKPPGRRRRRWIIPIALAATGAAIFGLSRLWSGNQSGWAPATAEVDTTPPVDSTSAPPPAAAPLAAPEAPRTTPPRQTAAARAAGDTARTARTPRRRAARDSAGLAPTSPTRAASDSAALPATPPPRAGRVEPGTATATGRLFVNATPWGQLFIDGQLVGNTPRANLELRAGTHHIRVARDGFEPFERTIEVAAGQEVRLTDIVLVERRP